MIQLFTIIMKLRFLVHTRAKRSPKISLTANYAKNRRKITENQKGVDVPRRCLKRETCAESAQNAIHVEETLPRLQNATCVEKMPSGWSECDTCQRNVTWGLRMRHLSTKCDLGAQNVIHVAETPSRRSECDTCWENIAQMLKTRYLLQERT